MDIELQGTKERIFDIAIRKISKDGFESVSMRDIATEAGIQVASIYSHFSSKNEILDTIYEYFSVHRLDNRNSTERIRHIIETGNALEIMATLSDTAFDFDEKMAIRMVLIPKIILMRIFKDPKANEFFLHKWHKDDIAHLKKWLGYALEIGRLPEDFDIENFSIFFWRQLIMIGIWAFADVNYEVKMLDEEKHLLQLFSSMLPLKEALKTHEYEGESV